jgi:hypothetical protein
MQVHAWRHKGTADYPRRSVSAFLWTLPQLANSRLVLFSSQLESRLIFIFLLRWRRRSWFPLKVLLIQQIQIKIRFEAILWLLFWIKAYLSYYFALNLNFSKYSLIKKKGFLRSKGIQEKWERTNSPALLFGFLLLFGAGWQWPWRGRARVSCVWVTAAQYMHA